MSARAADLNTGQRCSHVYVNTSTRCCLAKGHAEGHLYKCAAPGCRGQQIPAHVRPHSPGGLLMIRKTSTSTRGTRCRYRLRGATCPSDGAPRQWTTSKNSPAGRPGPTVGMLGILFGYHVAGQQNRRLERENERLTAEVRRIADERPHAHELASPLSSNPTTKTER